MKKYFTVGPSQLYPTVRQHITTAIDTNVPDDFSVFFVSSGTECLARTVESLAERHIAHYVNGEFSKRYYELSINSRKITYKLEAGLGKGFDC